VLLSLAKRCRTRSGQQSRDDENARPEKFRDTLVVRQLRKAVKSEDLVRELGLPSGT